MDIFDAILDIVTPYAIFVLGWCLGMFYQEYTEQKRVRKIIRKAIQGEKE